MQLGHTPVLIIIYSVYVWVYSLLLAALFWAFAMGTRSSHFFVFWFSLNLYGLALLACAPPLAGVCALQHAATRCNTLQHAATHCKVGLPRVCCPASRCVCTATHCNTLQHTATRCNTPQHTAIHWAHPRVCSSTRWCVAVRCRVLQRVAVWCSAHTHITSHMSAAAPLKYVCVRHVMWMSHVTAADVSRVTRLEK